jgi:hypothetical protein
MDRHAEQVMRGGRGVARRGFALAALLLGLASGCVTTEQLAQQAGAGPPPITQVTAFWSNQLLRGVDPVHNGAPMYGVAGRIYLFGPDLSANLIADGKLVVEMYGSLPEQPQGPPALLETWEVKKEILNSVCLRKDGFGVGYTLNLPWEHYRPDVTRLEFRMRYEPTRGMTIYGQNLVTLNGGDATPTLARRTETGDHHVITTSGPPPAPPPPVTTMPLPMVPVPAQMAAPPQTGGVQPAVFQVPGAQPLPGAGQR